MENKTLSQIKNEIETIKSQLMDMGADLLKGNKNSVISES